jgi:hypothetical protein
MLESNEEHQTESQLLQHTAGSILSAQLLSEPITYIGFGKIVAIKFNFSWPIYEAVR